MEQIKNIIENKLDYLMTLDNTDDDESSIIILRDDINFNYKSIYIYLKNHTNIKNGNFKEEKFTIYVESCDEFYDEEDINDSSKIEIIEKIYQYLLKYKKSIKNICVVCNKLQIEISFYDSKCETCFMVSHFLNCVECCICFEIINPKYNNISICKDKKHLIHKTCRDKMINNRKCPICRQPENNDNELSEN